MWTANHHKHPKPTRNPMGAGAVAGGFGHISRVRLRTGFCSTRPEPDPLPSLARVVEWNRNLLYWSYAKKALLLKVCLTLFGVDVGAVELC
jgi:hypothetical protein